MTMVHLEAIFLNWQANEWVEVVSASQLDEVRAKFQEWLEHEGLRQEQLFSDEVRIEIIRVGDGSRARFLVRREALNRLAANHEF
jgi:hypothetical protein